MADTKAEAVGSLDTLAEGMAKARAPVRLGRRKVGLGTIIQYGLLAILLTLMFVPIVLMISMSLRRTVMIYADFWGMPFPPYLQNYAVTLLDMMPSLGRTLWLYAMSATGIVLFACLAAFAFARLPFTGRELFFYIIVMLVMMIPGVVTLSPSFVLMGKLNLKGTLWGLAISYIAGGQPFAIW